MIRVTQDLELRTLRPGDFPYIIEICRAVYPDSPPWTKEQLASHLRVFPEGQFVAVDRATSRVMGMAASLIVRWDDYEVTANWRELTDHGMFTNHDPARGRTLYAAEVMVDAAVRGSGIGTKLYQARRDLVRRLGLLRIRAGARLRGYHRYADKMTAEQYAIKVARAELRDPTVSFQLRQGFHILGVIPGYLSSDPESQGYAALIEWLNSRVAKEADLAGRDPRFSAGERQ